MKGRNERITSMRAREAYVRTEYSNEVSLLFVGI
jgi:hypothetical protein